MKYCIYQSRKLCLLVRKILLSSNRSFVNGANYPKFFKNNQSFAYKLLISKFPTALAWLCKEFPGFHPITQEIVKIFVVVFLQLIRFAFIPYKALLLYFLNVFILLLKSQIYIFLNYCLFH